MHGSTARRIQAAALRASLEVARCLGQLAQEGHRPKRTIVFASWDAEEFGIIGSTEWVEDMKAELQQKAIAYLNFDIAATGKAALCKCHSVTQAAAVGGDSGGYRSMDKSNNL